jgi:hypothetical protein
MNLATVCSAKSQTEALAELLAAGSPSNHSLLYFYSSRCFLCRAVGPVIERVGQPAVRHHC